MEIEQIKRFKNCIGRELGLRKRVYPKWVYVGRMKQETADTEIATMSEIYEYFKSLEEENRCTNL